MQLPMKFPFYVFFFFIVSYWVLSAVQFVFVTFGFEGVLNSRGISYWNE